ncbi:hypothetical protein [Pantoea ananatis]|uniref:hypothetical protein n=1 Tax=Pantoea ananas TaxID=553 RepID=UPI00049722CA|nr:hypothetical protein [Pantoea ananatis]
MAKCNCLDQAKDMLHAHLVKDMPEGSELGDIWDGCGWDNQILSLGEKGGIHVMLKYKVAYRVPKKNGELSKNFTRRECSLKMSHCPLCGIKMEDSE